MRWIYECDLNGAIRRNNKQHDLSRHEEPIPPEVVTTICAELQKAPPLARFVREVCEAKSIAALNRILTNVFDEADRRRVWCFASFGKTRSNHDS